MFSFLFTSWFSNFISNLSKKEVKGNRLNCSSCISLKEEKALLLPISEK